MNFNSLKFPKAKSSNEVKPLRTQVGELSNNRKEQAELLFQMFSQEGEQVDLSNIPISPLELQQDFKSITHNEIQTNIRSLPNKKAPGPDPIPNELLKITGKVILNDL
ncbi:hypothetical protein O181_065906 [Austropuccinia psidii MF-1]|uniref:Uncharacterized protein n=1 Tax=Austropuccinia psidii MF-1 TaxID=1389203 RepID=A0A9Q3EWJ1_9BASI|nr:hypothetical protein [Austropuccinia psidii MF-1]